VKRYTYNTAGFLLKVETYTNSWQTQAEMTYDGLGNRIEMTAYSCQSSPYNAPLTSSQSAPA
jgi:YD repeat-containing protein